MYFCKRATNFKDMEKKTIAVLGMACAGCAANVERRLSQLDGIRSASVNFAARTALVEYDPKVITPKTMKDEIIKAGYDLVIDEDESVEAIERTAYRRLVKKVVVSWVLALLTMGISMEWVNIGSADTANQTMLILALLNLVYCGSQFYASTWKQLRHGTANMDTLVAMSTAISFVFSVFNTFWGDSFWGSRGIENNTYFDASVMIITFVLTGRMLEERAKKGTASAIRALMGLAPKTAHLVSGAEISDVPIAALEKGDTIEIRQGEKVPVDGIVTADEAYIDDTTRLNVASIESAIFTHQGKAYYAIPFKQDSVREYFDEEGNSLRKAFLKAPLDFFRITSRFTNARFHPILKRYRAHHGVDYAAPTGTPVHSIGDGTVIAKGYQGGGGGNYLKVKHNSVYTTSYMHLSRFAKGIQVGSHVRQGQEIAYVGSTGLSTGPHLDFRVYKNGEPIDPLKMEAPPSNPIRPELLDSFQVVKARVLAELDSLASLHRPAAFQAAGDTITRLTTGGSLSVLMNVIWICVGGLWICLTHLFFGLLLCVTVIGIPFGCQHFKMAALALAPFGKSIRSK